MADMAFYRCDVPGCSATIESEIVNDPTFGLRMDAHKRSHRLPVGTRVRITERWAQHAGRTGIVVHHDSGMSVYLRLDDEEAAPTLSEWRNGDGNWVWYTVAAERESLEVNPEPRRAYSVQSSSNPYDYHWTVVAGSEDEAMGIVRAAAENPEHRAYTDLQVWDIGSAAVKGVKE